MIGQCNNVTRIPREERICPCGQDIQSESHVLTRCELTGQLREQFNDLNYTDISNLMKSENVYRLSEFCHLVNVLVTT